jgi:hypothetical protein
MEDMVEYHEYEPKQDRYRYATSGDKSIQDDYAIIHVGQPTLWSTIDHGDDDDLKPKVDPHVHCKTCRLGKPRRLVPHVSQPRFDPFDCTFTGTKKLNPVEVCGYRYFEIAVDTNKAAERSPIPPKPPDPPRKSTRSTKGRQPPIKKTILQISRPLIENYCEELFGVELVPPRLYPIGSS